ncbi:hypothetical protein OH77DRAFT_1262920 [Trametes cingulata]|nr:hypothetical protein OH77DRAFT_1262920 [Trametes cingulata]
MPSHANTMSSKNKGQEDKRDEPNRNDEPLTVICEPKSPPNPSCSPFCPTDSPLPLRESFPEFDVDEDRDYEPNTWLSGSSPQEDLDDLWRPLGESNYVLSHGPPTLRTTPRFMAPPSPPSPSTFVTVNGMVLVPGLPVARDPGVPGAVPNNTPRPRYGARISAISRHHPLTVPLAQRNRPRGTIRAVREAASPYPVPILSTYASTRGNARRQACETRKHHTENSEVPLDDVPAQGDALSLQLSPPPSTSFTHTPTDLPAGDVTPLRSGTPVPEHYVKPPHLSDGSYNLPPCPVTFLHLATSSMQTVWNKSDATPFAPQDLIRPDNYPSHQACDKPRRPRQDARDDATCLRSPLQIRHLTLCIPFTQLDQPISCPPNRVTSPVRCAAWTGQLLTLYSVRTPPRSGVPHPSTLTGSPPVLH